MMNDNDIIRCVKCLEFVRPKCDIYPQSYDNKYKIRSLIIDNYDSFTYNLYELLARINGVAPLVIQNNCSLKQLEEAIKQCHNIIISPGPGRPDRIEDFGICKTVLMNENIKLPILGVCLGLQGLVTINNGTLSYAPPMHGRQSDIYHNHSISLFDMIPSPYTAIRYNSLIVNEPLPNCLESIAWTYNPVANGRYECKNCGQKLEKQIMGVQHKLKSILAVQYHPESICTQYGHQLLQNFYNWTVRLLNSSTMKINKEEDPRVDLRLKMCASTVYPYDLYMFPIPYVDTQSLFTVAFAKNYNAYWLDSSNKSLYDFMGDGEGDLSYSIQFNVNTLMVQESFPNKPAKTYKLDDHDSFLLHMQDRLDDRQANIYEYKVSDTSYELKILPEEDSTLPPFLSGFVGYIGYEMKAQTLSQPLSIHKNKYVSKYPDSYMIFADRLIVFNHKERCGYACFFTYKDNLDPAVEWWHNILKLIKVATKSSSNQKKMFDLSFSVVEDWRHDDAQYQDMINQCLKWIHLGEGYEFCLTNQVNIKNNDINHYKYELYTRLREINPAPYSSFISLSDAMDITILCSSPERFIRIQHGGKVESKPIKGTIRRGKNKKEDEYLKETLANSEKDCAENLMIVDLTRNDLSHVCINGSVNVKKLMNVESYETVHQLVSTVEGKLLEPKGSFKCVNSMFPPGSMTGAPKLRAVQLLESIELGARGIYSGCLGYFDFRGCTDLNVVIRTMIISNDAITIGTGGAIVSMSDTQEEYEEILLKKKALIKAIKN